MKSTPGLVLLHRRYEDQPVAGRVHDAAAQHTPLTGHMAAPVLSDIEIQRALGNLPGWSRRANVITKSYTMPTFLHGISFITRIADAAEAAQHHPDIDIRYTKITIALSTHDAGGLTQKDIDMAGTIERFSTK